MIPVFDSKGVFIKTISLTAPPLTQLQSYVSFETIYKPVESSLISTNLNYFIIALKQNEKIDHKTITIKIHTSTGMKYVIDRHPFTPIDSIKQTIINKTNIKNPQLQFQGKILQNSEDNLVSIGFSSGDIIYAFNPQKPLNQKQIYQIIVINSQTSQKQTIKIKGQQTLGHLKQQLSKIFNIPDIKLRLIFHNQILNDNQKHLSQFNINPRQQIQVVDTRQKYNDFTDHMKRSLKRRGSTDSFDETNKTDCQIHRTDSFQIKQKI